MKNKFTGALIFEQDVVTQQKAFTFTVSERDKIPRAFDVR
jgi:hypothetical protein